MTRKPEIRTINFKYVALYIKYFFQNSIISERIHNNLLNENKDKLEEIVKYFL